MTKWYRRQIKQIKVVKPDGQPIPEVKYVDINFRYIKDCYYSDVEWGVELCQKGETDGYPTDVYDDNIISEEDEDVIMYLNQLVRDGYIEIEDNPNIIWEDEEDED